jgi:hypothetical protein
MKVRTQCETKATGKIVYLLNMATKPFFICKYAPSSSAVNVTSNKWKRIKVRAHVRMRMGRESVRGHSEEGAHLRAPIAASIFWAAK